MKILIITHFFPPKHNAGTENYTFGIAKALQSQGHYVQVLCAEDWEVGDSYWNGVTDEIYQSVPVKRLHLNWKKAPDPNKIIFDSKVVEVWVSQYLNRELFDVVHVTSASSFGVGMMRSVKNAQIPLVLSLMDFWFLCPTVQLTRSNGELCDGITTALECQSCMMADWEVSQKLARMGIPIEVQTKMLARFSHLPKLTKQRGIRGRLLNMKERKELLQEAIGLPDLVLTHSKTVQEIFGNHTKRNIKLLRNGHELSWLKNYHGKSPSDKLRFGFIGQIIPIKGVHVLIEAFKKAKFNGAVKLDIWGDLNKNVEKNLEYVNKLKSMVFDDPSISLRGRFEHDNLADVFSNIDVLVVPSMWYENAPLVIQEAFATKTPVITTNIGGMAEAVSHNVDGLLFELGNVEDLSKQLRRFVETPNLREKLIVGIKAVKQVEQEVMELEENYNILLQQQYHQRI